MLSPRLDTGTFVLLPLIVRIPTMPISRSSGSRSVIPIDPDQCCVA